MEQHPQKSNHTLTHSPIQKGGLLSHDTFVMQQRTNFNSNNFEILDQQGNPVGKVETGGSTLGRMFLGSRELTITELDGTVLAQLKDQFSIGRERMTIFDANGQVLANVLKRFTLIHKRVDIAVVDGPTIELHGRLMDYDIQFQVNGEVVAEASRKWGGFSAGFLGHSRYVLGFTVETPPVAKVALLGGMLALDLIREKESRN